MHDDAAKCLGEPTDRAGTDLWGRAWYACAQHEVMCFSPLLHHERIRAKLKSLRTNAKVKMSYLLLLASIQHIHHNQIFS
jgi:hypothetical protein